MKRIIPLIVALLLPALTALAAEPGKPNIILVMADDFGYECVTANGGRSYATPHLDALAATGVRFTQCHVQPLCTPTRVQLMTGLYNVRNYVDFGLLPKTESTFGNVLKAAGYATGICGKWQLGQEPDLPQHFGFDEAYLWQHTRRPPRYANPGLEHNAKPLDFKNGEYGPKLVQDFALDFITRHQKEAFFLYYPMILTHDPFQPTPDSADWDPKTKGEAALKHVRHFADMTAYMDKLIGQLVAHLDALKLRENTLLIFLGDNGTHPSITSRFQDGELRGGKGTTTAQGTHVPLIVNWPAVIKEGRVLSDLISSTDFLSTLCEAAGARIPAKLDGVSFLPQLRGEPGTPRDWLYAWYWPRQNANAPVREFAFDHHYKLYRSGAFYDLAKDPMETTPLENDALIGPVDSARKKLQLALNLYKDARPPELQTNGATNRTKPRKKAKAEAKE